MSTDLAPESSSPLSLNFAAFSEGTTRGDVKDSAPQQATQPAPTTPTVASSPGTGTTTNKVGRTTAGQGTRAASQLPAPKAPVTKEAPLADRTYRASAPKRNLKVIAGILGVSVVGLLGVSQYLRPSHTGTVLAATQESFGSTAAAVTTTTTPEASTPDATTATEIAADHFADYGTFTGLSTRAMNTDCDTQPCMAGGGRQAVVSVPGTDRCTLTEMLDGRVAATREGELVYCSTAAIEELQAFFDGREGLPSQTEQQSTDGYAYAAAAELQKAARAFLVAGQPSFTNVPTELFDAIEYVTVVDMLPGGDAVVVDINIGTSCERVLVQADKSDVPLDKGTCPLN